MTESVRLGLDAKAKFKADPAKFISAIVNTYIETSPTNWSLPFQHPFFEAAAVISFGDGDSPEFLKIKEEFPWTLTARECLKNRPKVSVQPVVGDKKSGVIMPARAFLPVLGENNLIEWPKGEPPLPPWEDSGENALPPLPDSPIEHATCISIGLPIHSETLRSDMTYPWSNSPEMKLNSMQGAHCGFIADISLYLVTVLKMLGYESIAPCFTEWGEEFKMDFKYEGKTSRSTISPIPERDWAVAGGLGTYGLHDMVITERGTAVLLTTIITSAYIPPTKRPDKEYCLFYRDGSCNKCASRCPGQAIRTEIPGRLAANCDGGSFAAALYNLEHCKERMEEELGEYADMAGTLSWGSSGPLRPVMRFPSCARCYTDVPCATSIPD